MRKNMDKKPPFNPDENLENEGNIDINTDESLSGTSHLNEPVAEQTEIETLKAELQEQKDRYLRKVAEFENFKRRNAKERVELIQTAGKEVIIDLLDVLDDCDRAQKQIETSHELKKEIRDGLLLVFNKLRNTLTARGLKPMETIHQEFNPDLHDAITEIPAPSPELKGKIIDEIVKGYYLNDKIIRHAKVIVGK
jgi:molecular chaperone GrpE